jgi:hypothetical protein
LGAFLGVNDDVFDQHLGDGTTSLDGSSLQVLPEGACNAFRVEPRILPKGLVLDRDGGVNAMLWNLIQRQVLAVAQAWVEDLIHEYFARSVVDLSCLEVLLFGLDSVRVGQVFGVVGVNAEGGAHGSQDDAGIEEQDQHDQNGHASKQPREEVGTMAVTARPPPLGENHYSTYIHQ